MKKIISLGIGLMFAGATICGAADLSEYPQPFIKDGKLNAAIVVGELADPIDIIGAIDIAASLQYEMKQKTEVWSSLMKMLERLQII